MAVDRFIYDKYVRELYKAQKRVKRDHVIIKLVKKMIATKELTLHEEGGLNEMLRGVADDAMK